MVSYAIPTALYTNVQTVAPTMYFISTCTLPQTPWTRSIGVASKELMTEPSSCDEMTTPSHLRWLYKTFAYTPAMTDQNVPGIVGYLNEYRARQILRCS